MNEIKAVVFDLGNVILEINPDQIARAFNFSEAAVFPELKHWPYHHQYERGEIPTSIFKNALSAAIGKPLTTETFLNGWNQVYVGPVEGVDSQLTLLKENNIPFYILSNTNEAHFDYAKEHFPLLKLFDHIFTSHELGARKPEPEIYQRLLNELTFPSENILFIDDLKENLEAATKFGIQTEQCINSSQTISSILKRHKLT